MRPFGYTRNLFILKIDQLRAQIQARLCDLPEETRKQVESQIQAIQTSCERKEIEFKEMTQDQAKKQTGKN